MNIKAAKYLLVTIVKSNPQFFESLIIQWKKSISEKASKIFINEDDMSLLTLSAFSEIETLWDALKKNFHLKEDKNLVSYCYSDFHQEILEYQETIVSQESLLPSSTYLQMRHIEVPLERYKEYLHWRANTIFKYVKQLKTIDSFVAYHSIFSTLPGVMFICGFSCDPKMYNASFNSTAYKGIVQEAGTRFIVDGEKGLYTKIYKAL